MLGLELILTIGGSNRQEFIALFALLQLNYKLVGDIRGGCQSYHL